MGSGAEITVIDYFIQKIHLIEYFYAHISGVDFPDDNQTHSKSHVFEEIYAFYCAKTYIHNPWKNLASGFRELLFCSNRNMALDSTNLKLSSCRCTNAKKELSPNMPIIRISAQEFMRTLYKKSMGRGSYSTYW